MIVLAALDLDEFLDQLPAASIEECLDSGALRLEPETAGALSLGRNAQIRNEFAVMSIICAPVRRQITFVLSTQVVFDRFPGQLRQPGFTLDRADPVLSAVFCRVQALQAGPL